MFRPGATGQDSAQWSGGMVRDWLDPLTIIGGASALGSLASGILGSNAASSAADTQSAAARYAADLQAANQRQTRADLLPYNQGGQAAFNELIGRLPSLTSPITMDQASLEATPGYKFTRDQGLKSIQSANAAKGLGISGAALKGAAQYATGLADSTYQNRFANELASRQNAYNMLLGTSTLGENAGAQTGSLANTSTTNQTNALLSGATSQAAGDVGSANAISNALTGATGNISQYYLLNSLLAKNNNQSNQALGSGNTLSNGYYRY